MIADIKFACDGCGQRILVEPAAAGMEGRCPACGARVLVPADPSFDGEGGWPSRRLRAEPAADESSTTAPFHRTDANGDGTALEEELGFLRHLLEERSDECRRLTAAATHAQAEIKSFHTERLNSRAELAVARQRLASMEEERAQAGSALQLSEAAAAEAQTKLDIGAQRGRALQAQLECKERDAAGILDQLTASDLQVRNAASEIGSLHAEVAIVQTQLDTALSQLAASEATALRIPQAETDLRQSRDQRAAAEEGCRLLAICCDELKREAETLRRNLQETEAGHELAALRTRLGTLEEEKQRFEARAKQDEEELQLKAKAHQQSDERLRVLGTQLRIAEERAAASSESKLQAANDVLRGIVERQNAELQTRFVELTRLKRARFYLRMMYVVFALGLLGLAMMAIKLLPEITR